MSRMPSDLQALCQLARQHEDPSAEERQLVRTRLAARLAGASAAPVATSLSAKSAAATGTSQALAGVAASGATKAVALSGVTAWLGGSVTVGVGVALVAHAMSAPPAPVATMATTVTDGEIAPAASSVVERLAPKTPAAPVLRARESAAVPSGARESAVPSGARESAAVPPSLEQEARALAEVQRALRDGRASEALVLLAEQGKRYKSGALGVERAAARALALCAAGRFTEARPLAERFSRDHAGSPLADRVRRNCLDRGRRE